MKLTEALGILKKNGAIISEANKVDAGYDHRGWARYGFNSPNKNRGYVKMLNFLYHAENGMTKKMIHNWMGLSTAPGNHSATWTEMSDAGLAKYTNMNRYGTSQLRVENILKTMILSFLLKTCI